MGCKSERDHIGPWRLQIAFGRVAIIAQDDTYVYSLEDTPLCGGLWVVVARPLALFLWSSALVRRAIKDAQGKQERTRIEAARWLWTYAPTIAERAGAQEVSTNKMGRVILVCT